MIYIDGYGYVNNNIYATENVAGVTNPTSATDTSNTLTDTFEDILATETANLEAQEKTYNLNDIFKEASEKYNISEDLLKAIAYNESRFKPDVTSYAGAMGIMQLMPSTAKYLGVEDAYDPYDNIMGGAKLLSQLSEMYDGNEKLMIAAYNAGAGNVEKYGGVPPFKETQNYVEKVLNTLNTGVNTDGIVVTARVDDKAGNTVNDSAMAAVNGATSTDILSENASIQNTGMSKLVSDALSERFTYDEYKLLMTYFEQMLDIIQSMGEDNSSSKEEEDDSLADLFRLGGSNIVYNKSTINLL